MITHIFLSTFLSFFAALTPARVDIPLVIGHRGASGYLPEHTLEAYTLAVNQGADYIEPDLVMTQDGHLVARHENDIAETTDVAEKFPTRKRAKTIDGTKMNSWFIEDFTLAEVRSLRAKQRLKNRDQSHNGRYLIPTLDEIIQRVQSLQTTHRRPIGLYIETKHPTYFQQQNLALEPKLVATLKKYGLGGNDGKVIIQSFETSNLKSLRSQLQVPLIQLIEDVGSPYDWVAQGHSGSYADMLTPAGLQQIKTYADGIGPYKRLIVPESASRLQAPTHLISDAHQAGLLVHPWTFRSDSQYLHPNYQQPVNEYLQFYRLGVDGVFSDFPDAAVSARTIYLAERAGAK